ncbi:16S rRNA (adenine(1518)-N(6)/adenine(1519)-N(6))-dimethyltransferase RsmA [Fluoribacter dumoffii]|uniref:Ribosomal RNA small subunit methyltransferase A n=1 Tax=Fluoribacter dumoffii TaxID=463 RepID=A0A377G5C1_9GAMM|nr:16S rRNA (adenine(1518)-N(6)/adenine(1519)-N(6))-dimethyltransferase RsmA [Fluoribacter dumoffii]KTC91556.1 dimethyladenosine transferase (16S rRNA dimethylase) [Fluoribacter dumoffii NY 23]MCW8387320.1 16S rRNA (adenine(1518)-N(6)/adenine(1519)-N(6))-dimethyltransferase RsmA [Fluoribacter dumoffii]MCW8417173.1 16S rRNA (adenine(1518)-N(6)/adenine(1519)-N(6))-dimethyltransferase RsmA [Fluoribacter dumoffii]MCW8454987.1 16S rRNA (adenine(1518)-N(6)/adenine(1519)-N(6))-dimethyltransferase RsmA
MRHSPRKRFGQNFLQNRHIIDDIVRAINPQAEDNMLEIGPGLGALTEPLLRRLNKLTAVEIDWDLQKHLSAMSVAQNKLHLIAADALTLDYSQFGTHLRVVGNLPYNISTPLLIHLLNYASHIEDMHFMLQKEVVERMAAQPGSKAYGRLTVMLQYHCVVEYLFDVPPEAFDPQPKVDSAVVRLTPHRISPFEKVSAGQLERLVASAFAMRRKTLNNNLKGIITAEQLSALGIDGNKRPEQISIAEYVQLAKFISN